MLLDEIESMLKESGFTLLRDRGMLVFMVGEKEKEVVIYIVTEEERSQTYILATSYPPLKAEGWELDLMRASWDLMDEGIPCKVAVNRDFVIVEMELDSCHLNKDYLLESIYLVAEGMLSIMDKFRYVSQDLDGSEGSK